jgi:15-cis-phytoene synthase
VAAGAHSAASLAASLAASAREGEPDRYLAALLAPPAARDGLLALAAFAAELARIPQLVTREPAMGEIRLQWWRDALELPAATRSGHPVADAVRAAVDRHALPVPLLLGIIDARSADLQSDVMPDETALDDYLWKTEGALFALAAGVLQAGPDAVSAADVQAAAAAAGRAYGLARLLVGLPLSLSRGRLLLPQTRLEAAGAGVEEVLAGATGPTVEAALAGLYAQVREHLDSGRQHVAKLPRGCRAAFLPLALVGPYVRALERVGRNPLREPAEIAPLTRVWAIGAAHWLGRL